MGEEQWCLSTLPVVRRVQQTATIVTSTTAAIAVAATTVVRARNVTVAVSVIFRSPRRHRRPGRALDYRCCRVRLKNLHAAVAVIAAVFGTIDSFEKKRQADLVAITSASIASTTAAVIVSRRHRWIIAESAAVASTKIAATVAVIAAVFCLSTIASLKKMQADLRALIAPWIIATATTTVVGVNLRCRCRRDIAALVASWIIVVAATSAVASRPSTPCGTNIATTTTAVIVSYTTLPPSSRLGLSLPPRPPPPP
ncbi:hypothetical protein Bbelb_393630 [Branchiostoma belcheri]|nr:hypothetical protein Bbelb_393630 [Branchiostoma belcheri]